MPMIDPTLIVPMPVELADSWRIDKSDFSYTFHVRKGVKFHNGDLLELEDIKYSYEAYLDRHVFYKKFADAIEINRRENSVKLKLKRWLELHDLPNPYIAPRAFADEDFCPIGTGPSKLTKECQKALRKGSKQPVVLESNSDYFGTQPSIQNIRLRAFGDADALKDSLRKKDVNFAVDLDWDESDEFEVSYGVRDVPFYLVLKQDNEICKDADFRKAVHYTLDRKGIIDVTRKSLGIRDARFLPNYNLYDYLTPFAEGENNHHPKRAKEFWEKAKASLNENERDYKAAPGNRYRRHTGERG